MNNRFYILFLIIPVLLVSCVPRRKLIYTQDQKPKELQNEYINIRPEKTIQPFDNVFIKVSSIDEQTANIFANKGAAAGQQNINLLSYTVDGAGYVNFPFVGDIYVKDLTINEAQEKIEEEVGQYLSNISISVKFVNNTVAILGEVRKPGNHDFYRDQVTIFQALSLAGGIGDFGDKTNIILVREAQGKINYHYINLTNKDVVSSDYYYLIPNDVLIVRPVRQKYRNLSLINLPLFLTTITTAVTLYFLFRNN